MKKIIVFIILALSTGCLFAQMSYLGGHDSLLFDGAEENVTLGNPCDSGDCLIKITKLEKGFAHVWRCKREKGLLCGVKEVWGNVVRKEILGVGDYVRPGDTIDVTGKDAQISLSWNDKGILIDELYTVTFRTAQKFVIPKDFCETNKEFDYENGHIKDLLKIPLIMGDYFMEVVSGHPFEVTTERCATGVRGTKFRVEVKDNEDVIKVYEGKVEITPKKYNFSANEEMAKLTADFQAGKITIDEYTAKAKELAPRIKEDAEKTGKKIFVEAGYQITIGDGTISDIIPIAADDDKWWEK